MNRTIPGFDYRTGRPRELALREWRQEIALIEGARRRVENGETFISTLDGLLVLEVYERITL